MPANRDAKNAVVDLKARYTSPLIASVDIAWPAGLIIYLFFNNYLLLPVRAGAGSGLRYLLNAAQVLSPTFPSAARPFAF